MKQLTDLLSLPCRVLSSVLVDRDPEGTGWRPYTYVRVRRGLRGPPARHSEVIVFGPLQGRGEFGTSVWTSGESGSEGVGGVTWRKTEPRDPQDGTGGSVSPVP